MMTAPSLKAGRNHPNRHKFWQGWAGLAGRRVIGGDELAVLGRGASKGGAMPDVFLSYTSADRATAARATGAAWRKVFGPDRPDGDPPRAGDEAL